MDTLNKLKAIFSEFFKKNKSAVYLLPLMMVLLVVVIIMYSGGFKDRAVATNGNQNQTTNNTSSTSENSKGTSSENKVEVLPQTERTADDEKENTNTSNPVNPFELPMKLSGVLVGSNGDGVAIIETSQNSYIVREGELINNTWKVSKIEEKGVLLLNGDKEAYIEFSEEQH